MAPLTATTGMGVEGERNIWGSTGCRGEHEDSGAGAEGVGVGAGPAILHPTPRKSHGPLLWASVAKPKPRIIDTAFVYLLQITDIITHVQGRWRPSYWFYIRDETQLIKRHTVTRDNTIFCF